MGNRLTTTTAVGRVWSATYDALSRPLTATDPLGHTVTGTYDANGNRTLAGKADGVTNRYVYDAANRLTGVDLLNNASIDISFVYDAASRRTSMADGTGTTTYVYNAADRRTSMTAPVTGTVGYGYDAAGRLTTLTYPSFHQVSYGYDDRGRLASVTDWASRTTTYGYDAANRPTTTAYPNTVTTSRTYDAADRLLTITHAQPGVTLESMSYVYDDASNRTSMADSSGTTSFTYDALNRLTQAAYPNGDYTTYGYDLVGNRTSITTNGVPRTNTFDAANRMTASGTDIFAYDANGNQTSQSVGGITTTYTYDALDRLTGLTSGGTTATYGYNGDGLRVRKTVGGVTTNDTWADVLGGAQLVADGTNEYVYGLEFISQVATSTGVASYPLGDALGSTRLVNDATGATAGTTQYDAYGSPRAQTGQQSRLGYTGQQQDAESGLIYLRGRYYDPTTGRFLSQDSVGAGGSYAYANNNPTRFVDPSGHIAQPICGTICKMPTQEIMDSGCGWQDCLPNLARLANIIFQITGKPPVLVSHSPATVMCADPCGGGGLHMFPFPSCGLFVSCSPSVDDIINDLIDQFIEAACNGSFGCAAFLSMQRDTIKACVLAGAGCDRIHVSVHAVLARSRLSAGCHRLPAWLRCRRSPQSSAQRCCRWWRHMSPHWKRPCRRCPTPTAC